MPRQQPRRLARRTELKHCGQRRFQNHLLLHAATADRRKSGERFEEIVERGARLTRRRRDQAFADQTLRRQLRIGGTGNIDRADRGRIVCRGQDQQRMKRDEWCLRRKSK